MARADGCCGSPPADQRRLTRTPLPTILPLATVEPPLVDALLDAAFGPDRHARTAYRIRAGEQALPGLSFAALDEDDYLAGTIQLWPVGLTEPSGARVPLLMVGPVGVLPHLQGAGYGTALLAAALSSLKDDAPPQVLIGDAPYYARFGFSSAPPSWRCPGPFDLARLLVRGAETAVLPREGMLGPWTPPVEAD